MDLSKYESCNWKNTYVDSVIPDICKEQSCVLGVDEAGRGPVLGPMVYGICYCPVSFEKKIKELGAADSKTLSEEKREKLFYLICENNGHIGWSLELISPQYISNCMYRNNKISLNDVSQNAAANLIQRAIDHGVKVQDVFVDTVGDPQKYETKLQEIFPTLNITVAKKADAVFPVVSAASICAKVSRDRALQSWIFPEAILVESWGSGYPGDSVTKNFLINTADPVFGFPAIVRFSWSTAEKIMKEKCVEVKWMGEEEEKERTLEGYLQYFSRKRKNSEEEEKSSPKLLLKRHFYFTDRFLERVEAY